MEEQPTNTPAEIPSNVLGNAGIVSWQTGLALAINETYNFANDSLFLGVLPAYYRDFAWRYLRPALQWLDGYVPELHAGGTSGIMATRIGSKLITGLTKQVAGEKLIFKPNDKNFTDDTKQALIEISKWYDDNNIMKAVYAAIGFALGLGTSLLKANVSNHKTVWWEAARFDRCFYLADFKNEIKEATFLIRGYVDTRKDKTTAQFFLVEHRYYHTIKKNDKLFPLVEKQEDGTFKTIHKVGELIPMVEYQVHRVNGTTQNNTMPSVSSSSSVGWDEIPSSVRKAIKENYSVIKIDTPQRLPFNDLGVVALLNGKIDLSIPTGTNFGESMLVGIQDDLIIYEVACSYLLRDMYLGKGTVYVPKSLNLSMVGNMGLIPPNDVMQGIGEGKMETVPGVDPDSQKIVVQQFEIRAEEWQKVKENALKSIAVKWGMSPKILASFLAGSGAQQTATQVDSEDDLALAFVYHTRAYFKNPLNKLLETTLNFMGIPNNVKIDFASPSLLNKDRLINRVTNELQAGLIDVEDAIRTIYPDLDEPALRDKIDKAKAAQEELKKQMITDFNPDGSFGDEQQKEDELDGSTLNENEQSSVK